MRTNFLFLVNLVSDPTIYFQEASITISSVTDGMAPAGTFAIPKDFERGTMADLRGGQ
jgi:hypothetical protein